MIVRCAARVPAATVAVAVALAGCGAATDPVAEALPVVEAEPITADALGRDLRLPAPTAAPTPAPTPTATPTEPAEESGEDDERTVAEPSGAPTASDQQGGPTTADAAAFVRATASELGTAEHVVVDLDGDAEPEVVLTGVLGQRAVLRLAWWTDGAYEVLTEQDAGPGLVVADLRVADVNADGRTEVLVEVEGEGRRSLALFAVLGRGRVATLAAVGGCHDGSHVYGVTGARLEARQGAPPAIVATCDDSPLPVKDWSEQRWVWRDGAYRIEDPPQPARRADDDGDDGRDGRDEDGDNDDESDDSDDDSGD